MTRINIRRVEIRRFRGVQSLTWMPHPRLNIILGAADGGKSTVLEAIALLFSPAPNFGLSEFDYYRRDVAAGFSIEAILSVGDAAFLRDEGFPAPPMQGMLDGKLSDLPDEAGAEPVLVCRLTATSDQETLYEVIGAGGEIRVPFSRAMRRRIGLARLGVADRGDRDIRLVQGGALDRYLQGKDVRRTVMQAVMNTPLHDQLEDGPKSALAAISDGFAARNLPNPVRLGLVGTPGVSLAASVGLTVGASDPDALPLTAWGTGTRRLAALEISSLGVSADAIAVIDEPETGLEPYRQRVFIRDLAAHPRQAFITTHAPAVLSQASKETSQIWRIGDPVAHPKEVKSKDGEEQQTDLASHALFSMGGGELNGIANTQPEALFAKLPIVCEGVTEVGFATRMLEHRFGAGFSCRGLYCLDAGGHYKALPICKALLAAGFPLAAVVDDEGRKAGNWAEVGAAASVLRWQDGACLEMAVLSVMPDSQLQEAHHWADHASHRSAVHQLAELRKELGLEKVLTAQQMFEEVGRERFLRGLLARACPKPDGDRKPRGWFKSHDGGYLLADKLLSVTPTPALMLQVDAFLMQIEKATAP
jgi:putative ATP-dependent endonuclease of the OLD family